MASLGWRIAFGLAAVFMAIGGPQHPDGTLQEMLASPVWFVSHAWVFVSFVSLLIGLLLYRRSFALTGGVRWWLGVAILVTALEVVEMAMHTIANVDLDNLLAGQSTPVLTTHLTMTMIVYPVFGVLMSIFIVMAARARALGSPWMAGIGVLGALAHGAAGLLVVGFNIEAAGFGFPLIMLVMVWALIAALMPVRASRRTA